MKDLENNKEHQNLRIAFHKETGMYAIKHKKEYTYWLEKRVVNNINYKHCSEQLKDDNILPFNKWKEVNKYTKMFIYYKKDGAVFSFREVLDKYISYTNSF